MMCFNEIVLTICTVSSIRNLLVYSCTYQVPKNQYGFAELTILQYKFEQLTSIKTKRSNLVILVTF